MAHYSNLHLPPISSFKLQLLTFAVVSICSVVGRFVAVDDDTPADQSEVTVDLSTESDLVSLVRADVLGEQNSCVVVGYGNNITATRSGTDVNKECFVGLDVFDPLPVLLRSNDSLQEGGLDVDLNVHLWHLTWVADDLTDEVVRSGKLRINFGSYSDETTWNGEHQLVLIGLESLDN